MIPETATTIASNNMHPEYEMMESSSFWSDVEIGFGGRLGIWSG
jgi:hypothetical protein